MTDRTFAAVDLGASSGRVLAGVVGPDRLEAEVVGRFDNVPIHVEGSLCWDLDRLWDGMIDGLRAAAGGGELTSVGIDAWAVDYGLLDGEGRLLHAPFHYRDGRTEGVLEHVRETFGADRLYGRTGIAFQPFNTAYQLLAEPADRLAQADRLLMMPDLLGWRLTGTAGTERTNASSTQLYDPVAHGWADDVIGELGLPRRILTDLHDPGTPLGRLRPELRQRIGADPVVVRVASHDTASAVAAVPADTDRFAYISCGTWSLVGMELDRPVLTEASLAENFTNEVGVDATIRYLRNVMGLWLLQECSREWQQGGTDAGPAALTRAAAGEPALRSVVDAQAAEFFAPGDMPARIQAHCRRAGYPVPETPPAITRCILDSLAIAHARTIAAAQRLADREVDVIHLVGGGSQNELLCQLTADACGLPVLAGPVEATALGNLLEQARGAGILSGRDEVRALCRSTQPLTRYEPATDRTAWAALL